MKTRYPQSNLAACVIPWKKDCTLDHAVFENHVQHIQKLGYTKLYILGTASEGYALDNKKYKDIVKTFTDLTLRKSEPQVCIISLSLAEMIERIDFAANLGIEMFQIALPSWGELDFSEIRVFFKEICHRFPSLKFLHYNLQRAKRIITGKEYRILADENENLVATKNSTTDYARTADLLKYAPDLQHFLLENNFAMGISLGECSLLCSYAALFPKTTFRFYQAGIERDLTTLFEITDFIRYTEIKLFEHCQRQMIDASFDKTIAWLLDPNFSNQLLPPYLGLSDIESQKTREVYQNLDIQ